MNVNASVTTKQQSVPANPAASLNLRFKLFSAIFGNPFTQEQIATLPNKSVTFTGVPDGSYVIQAQRMSAADPNVGIGAVAESAAVNVVNPVDLEVPDVMSVTLG
jgi:hypothetical protein